MDFGKTYDLEGKDFRLPDDADFNQKIWTTLEHQPQELSVFVGCTGYGMPEWVGDYYPTGTKPTGFLKEYTRQFNTIEHNTTHYRIPDVPTVKKWRDESAADFKFCPKMPQSISHSRFLGVETGIIEHFCNSISLLEHKLGTCFMQLPPHFSFEKLHILKHFLAQFPTEIPLSIELRHESFFDDTNNLDAVFELLYQHKVGTVITDVCGRRDVLHQGLTTNFATIRFVGNDLHPTDFQRIDDWVARILEWKEHGLKTIYFFTHEPDNIKAPELAAYFVTKLLNHKIKVRGPKKYEQSTPQLSLF
jgi:uncharacterized protein YecE (DUF72 family)